MKKAKATSKVTVRKPAKKRASKNKKPKDLSEARQTITDMVRAKSNQMAAAVMGEGLKGKVAPVKYLFEATGIFPATSATEEPPEKETLARKLLDHMGFSANPSESGEANRPGASEPAGNRQGRDVVSRVESDDVETEIPETDEAEE